MSRFDGKAVFITGGAQGMGLAVARICAAEGARIALADLKGAQARDAASTFGGVDRAIGLACDVTDRSQVEAAFTAALDAFGGIDAVFCCAGAGDAAPFLDMTDAQFESSMRPNLVGTFMVAQIAARHMAASGRKGAIVTVSSVQAAMCSPALAAYATSKAAVSGLTRAMAIELAPHGIRANAVAPGPMATEMLLRAAPPGSEAERAMLARTPLGRFADPSEMAEAAVFLASDQSSYITGQTLYCDGGRTVLNFTMADRPNG
ncbi:MAG: SDR family NAD(P)-dependent oxidoreductase [Hyphomonadaceae bacterium]